MTELKRSIEKVIDDSELPKRLRDRVRETMIDRGVEEKSVAEEIVQAVSAQYEATRVDPLEPVGTVSAQSIGEPGTQMSVRPDERIIVRTQSGIENPQIAEVVDSHLEAGEVRTIGDHEVALADGRQEVLSLSRDGAIHWKPIQEVSRHLAPDELLEIETVSGRAIQATKGHSFVTRESGSIEPVRADRLAPGDELPIVDSDLAEGTADEQVFTDGGMESVSTYADKPVADAAWEPIERIEAVDADVEYVYDVSVEGLETFTTAEGIVTHNTMNTFHYAGVAEIDVTQGLPRLIELVDARKKPDTPMMTVYLEDEYAADREKAHEVVWQIEATRILSLGDVSTNVADMRVTVTLNEETLEERLIEPEAVAERIESQLGVDTTLDGTVIEFGPTQPSYRELLQLVEDLRDIVFKGIDDISRVVIRKEELDDGEEFVLYTEGSSFGDVLDIDGVDGTRTITNDIHEVYKNLGVEAAREAIINETMETLEEQGLDDVNVRHLMLVSDIMTNNGEISSIGRHGISGAKESVLARAAFEVTVNHLLDAAVHGEIDTLAGVTENVIVGKPIKLGTGDVDLRVGTADK